MAQNVIAADQVTVEWSADGVDGNYVEIVGCKTVGIPEVSQDYRDRTSLDSPAGFKEFGPGLKDAGELTLSCFYSVALYKLAALYNAARKPVYFRVIFPAVDPQVSGDQFVYQAYVNPSVPSVDGDGDLMTDLKLRTTGAVTWTEGPLV